MDVASLLSPHLVFPDLAGSDSRAVLRDLAERITRAGATPDSSALYRGLVEREAVGSTAVGGGVAIPHCKVPGLTAPVVAVARVPQGVDLDAPDGEPVDLLFVVLSPEHAPAAHLKCLAAVSRWIKDEARITALRELDSAVAICERLARNGGS